MVMEGCSSTIVGKATKDCAISWQRLNELGLYGLEARPAWQKSCRIARKRMELVVGSWYSMLGILYEGYQNEKTTPHDIKPRVTKLRVKGEQGLK
jgi:hypothetical protein